MKYLDIFTKESKEDLQNYIVASYYLKSKTTLRDAAYNLAVGQSIGNPSLRNEFETDSLISDYCARIIAREEDYEKSSGEVKILFHKKAWNASDDGIPSLLVQVFGGQADIDIIEECHLNDIKIPDSHLAAFRGPKIGLSGMRKFCQVSDSQPLFGGIVKPKIGLSPKNHLEIVKKLVDGGCNFIKEDEILSLQSWCDVRERTEIVMDYIRNSGRNVYYCVSLQSKSSSTLGVVPELVKNHGCNGVHINFHVGFGIYQEVRDLDLPILMHYQKSGDRLFSHDSHKYRISECVMFYLASISGCDTLHAGMIGGYLNSNEKSILDVINSLVSNNSVPALSCGMHPGLIDFVKRKIGHNNWMANVGGAIMSHPMGTLSGAKAMSQAVRGQEGLEYLEAVKKWGKVE